MSASKILGLRQQWTVMNLSEQGHPRPCPTQATAYGQAPSGKNSTIVSLLVRTGRRRAVRP
jgi:hypothetical protein